MVKDTLDEDNEDHLMASQLSVYLHLLLKQEQIDIPLK